MITPGALYSSRMVAQRRQPRCRTAPTATRAGVRLDVMPIDTNSGPDVMVRAVEAPDRARPNDAIIVTAKSKRFRLNGPASR